jgi:tripartite motif-containing protein 71
MKRTLVFACVFVALSPASSRCQTPALIAIWDIHPAGFAHPVGIAVATDGDVFVANRGARNLQSFTSDGVMTLMWGSYGSDSSSITGPQGIAVDSEGHVFVAEEVTLAFAQTHFQVFSTTGTYLGSWGHSGISAAAGEFQGPFGVAVGPGNRVYVTDPELGRTQVFTNEGVFITQWPTQAYGIAVDAAGNVFVTENDGVRKYTGSGAELAHWGTAGTHPGQFNGPLGIAVDAIGIVYVADTRNCRVQLFTGSGAFITQWGALGSGPGQFDTPQGIAVDAAGRVYVADSYNNRVQVFGSLPTPAKAESWGSIKARYR